MYTLRCYKSCFNTFCKCAFYTLHQLVAFIVTYYKLISTFFQSHNTNMISIKSFPVITTVWNAMKYCKGGLNHKLRPVSSSTSFCIYICQPISGRLAICVGTLKRTKNGGNTEHVGLRKPKSSDDITTKIIE